MRPLGYLVILSLFFSCKQSKENKTTEVKDVVKKITTILPTPNPCDTAEWYKDPKDRDSVLVYEDDGSKGYYKKGELKRILKSYPELNNDEVLPPDEAYAKRGMGATVAPCDSHFWSCEVCRDSYYIFYAHFLKQRYKVKKYAKEREDLIKIYRNINYIFGRLAVGGTYFGHQYQRILGYAEYSIYLLDADNRDYYYKRYNISAQKNLYIKSLNQLVTDEVENNFDISQNDKPSLKKELLETVKQIDSLVNNYYYLTMAKEFQYSHY